MHASIYDEALSQLHMNYQSLQENIINMVREQTRMSETISRLQLDLESYKDTQNERLDDMLCNVDTDVKRVFHEIRKVENVMDTRVTQWKNNCDSYVGRLMSDIEFLKPKVKHLSESSDGDEEKDPINGNVSSQIDNIRAEWKAFRDELEGRFCSEKSAIDPLKLAEHVENSTITKIENYISNEVVDEIIKTIDNNLSDVKAEFDHELELQNIRIEDTKAVVDVLKDKVNDIQSSKKCFNESDIFASSVDLTRTPISVRQGYFKSPIPARVATPILEEVNEDNFDEENEHERDDILDTNGEAVSHDITLYEDIGNGDIVSQNFHKDTLDNNNDIKDPSNEIEVVELLSQGTSIVQYGFREEQFNSARKEHFQIYSHSPASSTKSKRRESLISNIFINLTSILDV